jgi:hypothetical protein
MGREQALEMMNDVLLSERDHLRAVNADLMDALETLYNWCVEETKAGGHLGPGHEWPHARRVIAKHRG